MLASVFLFQSLFSEFSHLLIGVGAKIQADVDAAMGDIRSSKNCEQVA